MRFFLSTAVSCVLLSLIISTRFWTVLDRVLLITQDDQPSHARELVASSATASAYGSPPSLPWLRRLHPIGNPDSSILSSHVEDPSPSPRSMSHTHIGFTSVRVNAWSVRAIHCFAFHAVIAPRPKREMCELRCASNSSLLTFAGSALCFCVFLHSSRVALVLHLAQA